MLKTVRGQQGVVKFGAVPAATLRAFTLVARDDAPHVFDLVATATDVNRFYLSQAPLQLTLYVGSRQWRWQGAVLELVGGQITGTVTGRPEVK